MHRKLSLGWGLSFLAIIVALALAARPQNSGSSISNGSGAPTGACVSGSVYTDSATGNAWTCTGGAWKLSATSGIMSGTTGSIGGSLLALGSCSSGTATVTGAVVGMPAVATPSDGTNIAGLGVVITATVTSSNTVTVNVCALVSLTPASKTYTVRIVP
jgi:hypothetical protein